MLEMMLCSLLTILPDYLYRRYVQGKRFGKEITLYSVWFELRWGITTCLILTVMPDHGRSSTTIRPRPAPRCFSEPSRSFRRGNGRVAEIYVGISGPIDKGAPIFRLDSSKQEAAVRNGAPQDCRGRGGAHGGASRCREGRGPAPGGQGKSPAGDG